MVRSRLSALVVPVALLASGCTITTYSNEPPPPRQPKARPATAAPAATPGRKGPSYAPRPGAVGATGATGGGGTETTPRISGPIAFGSSQAGAFRGLAYVVPPDTKKVPDFASLVPFALMFTDSFNVSSQEFTTGFPGALAGQVEFFAIRYDGRFSLPNDGNWQFKVTSDDGAILSIDGVKVVDNDGLHTATSATGQATLKAGAHALRLDYLQAKGPVALQVFMVVNGQERVLVGTK